MRSREIGAGHEIPSESYADQPYIVITKDGNWLCVLTTGPSTESQAGQHVVATISEDQGKTWSDLIPIEPGLESADWHMTSWVTALVVPSGRVYAFYNYRYDETSTQHGGWLCYRYSDDNGRTWSDRRYRVPMRKTKRDRENVTGGTHQFFWCIDKPVVSEGSVYFAIPKLYSGVPLDGGEGWIIHSDDILTEDDPEAVHWELLPDGDVGVWSPELGTVQEEQNLEVLSDGSLYTCYRTEIGHPAYAISRDGGHTWTTPRVMRYATGNPIKTPRACPRIWKASNGKFLFWFHNNSYPGWGNSAVRNPVWVSGGVEVDGEIQWSQPEILLFCADPTIRGMSYPDFVEQDGRIWVSETEKVVARVHELDPELLGGLWQQHTRASVAKGGLVFASAEPLSAGDSFALPTLPDLRDGGFALDLWFELDDTAEGQVLLDSFGWQRLGFRISTVRNQTLKIEVHDGRARRWLEVLDGVDRSANVRSVSVWNATTDEGVISPHTPHHAVFIVDGLANIVTMLIDGVLCDGGASRIQGWWRLNPYLGDINGDGVCQVAGDVNGRIRSLRIYDRYLRTSEAIANYRAGHVQQG